MAVDYEAVKNASVISTGSAAMHREHMYGSRRPALWWVTRGKEWIADVPLNVFVIEHGDGLESFAKVQAMKAHTPDLVVVASHDTTAASKLEAARTSMTAVT